MAPFSYNERTGQVPDDDTGSETETDTTTTTDAPTGTKDATTATGDEFDAPRAKALIDKLRLAEKQGKTDAKALADATAKLAAIETAALSEQEKVAKERDDLKAGFTALEATNRENAVKLAVFSKQAEMGIADSDLALAMLDRSAIEYDDAGQPTNVGDLLTALLDAKPILKGTPAKPPTPKVNSG
ncbi:MAG: hypothetical protein NUW01_02915, partial [Gemmatimonadaceae bacterium]|nr:hypothetical protein [Gemmatimonadaceae bacterium]